MNRPVALNIAKSRMWLRPSIGCALGGALGAVLLLGAAPARAQQDDRAPDVKFLDGIMGAFGLSRGGEASIDYRERSPLVIPPNAALPPPKSANINDPNWPVDPEVRRAKAEAGKDDGMDSSERLRQNSLPLPYSEIEKGRTSKKQPNTGSTSDGIGQRSTWSELGYKGGIFGTMFSPKQEEVARFTGEAPRASLIDPPTGYQTPSASQPYGLGKDKAAIKPTDYYLEHGSNLGK
jgi:hypothetical protein